MDSIWQERGRKQSKPGAGSRSFQTRQILGLRLSQDRRESLVLFWIPRKISILFNPFFTCPAEWGKTQVSSSEHQVQGTSYKSILQPCCFSTIVCISTSVLCKCWHQWSPLCKKGKTYLISSMLCISLKASASLEQPSFPMLLWFKLETTSPGKWALSCCHSASPARPEVSCSHILTAAFSGMASHRDPAPAQGWQHC